MRGMGGRKEDIELLKKWVSKQIPRRRLGYMRKKLVVE